jgi:purine-binding chemotaxis protein CheW
MTDTAIERPVATQPARVTADTLTRDAPLTDHRYLTFTLAGDVYALDILDITEIIEFRKLTVVPMMPPFIRGVINLRGRVLPVIDLASRFGQDATKVEKRTSIIVIETHVHDGVQGIGILVDAVNKVIHLGPDDMEPAPDFGAGIRADFIDGMARYDEQFIIVLGIDKVLDQHDLHDLTAAHQFPAAE